MKGGINKAELNSLIFQATVYTQVGRLPKPLSDAERGFEDGSPSLGGKGLGVRSGAL